MKTKLRLSIFQALAFLLLSFNLAHADIPEPDYLIYGKIIIKGEPITAIDTHVSVEAYLDGLLIDDYRMGDDASLLDQFVLKIPIDSVGERTVGFARPGDEIQVIFILGPELNVETLITIEDRGVARKLDAVDTDDGGIFDFNDDDDDNDLVLDVDDNCPLVVNPDQLDTDDDGQGDACDDDDDNDGVDDDEDAFPLDKFESEDTDGDGVGNIADNCPDDSNPNQRDTDGDKLGDACDSDIDEDTVPNELDNCPVKANPGQEDEDDDDIGDVCDECLNDPENKCVTMCFPIKSTGGSMTLICL